MNRGLAIGAAAAVCAAAVIGLGAGYLTAPEEVVPVTLTAPTAIPAPESVTVTGVRPAGLGALPDLAEPPPPPPPPPPRRSPVPSPAPAPAPAPAPRPAPSPAPVSPF